MRKCDHLAGLRAKAIPHLDDGRAVVCVAKALQFGVNAVRAWRHAFRERGLESLGMAGRSKREGPLSATRKERLKALTAERPQRNAVEVRARIAELSESPRRPTSNRSAPPSGAAR